MDRKGIENLLVPPFPKKHAAAALGHFERIGLHLQQGEWEDSIAKGGKFVEAAMKSLYARAGQTVPTGKAFKVDSIINGLGGLPAGSVDDTIRITIPRACRFVYEIASNRGGRHDPDEIDPNEMDASTVAANCSWILGEMIRHAQHAAVDANAAKTIVDSLTRKRYPLIEEVDGRVYFHYPKQSAPDVALLALAYCYPRRMNEAELVATVHRHGFKKGNAQVAVSRIKKYADDDGSGNLRVLGPGLKRAEELMSKSA